MRESQRPPKPQAIEQRKARWEKINRALDRYDPSRSESKKRLDQEAALQKHQAGQSPIHLHPRSKSSYVPPDLGLLNLSPKADLFGFSEIIEPFYRQGKGPRKRVTMFALTTTTQEVPRAGLWGFSEKTDPLYRREQGERQRMALFGPTTTLEPCAVKVVKTPKRLDAEGVG